MENAADFNGWFRKRLQGATRCKIADPHDPFRLQNARSGDQMPVARGEQDFPFGRGQFVRRAISSRAFEECERAVVDYEVLGKKTLRTEKAFREKPPEPLPADFQARTIEAGDATFWMLANGLADGGFDSQPIPNSFNFTERHAGLNHAEWPGIHSQKNHALPAGSKFAQIRRVTGPGVIERIVNMSHRRGELQRSDFLAQALRRRDEAGSNLGNFGFRTSHA